MTKLWRKLVDRLMLFTFGYENADVNRWRDCIHQSQSMIAQLRSEVRR